LSWEQVTACGKDQIVRIAVSIIPERLSDEDFSVLFLLPEKEGKLKTLVSGISCRLQGAITEIILILLRV
jgi:hypothetical protein